MNEQLPQPPDPRDLRTVAEIIDNYLLLATEEMAPRSRENTAHILTRFRDYLGSRLVKDCLPFDLQKWIVDNSQWKSGHTRRRINGTINRVFNWARQMRLVRDNPFAGLQFAGGETGRDMTDDEFQVIMRHADRPFQRFLLALKLTGARPGELSALRWHQIDWQRGIAVLPQHKTFRKTGKPRILYFLPAMLALLAWLQRQRPPAPEEVLRGLLAHGPVADQEVIEQMKAHGFSSRTLFQARRAIGANLRPLKPGPGSVYELSSGASAPPPDTAFVFLNSKAAPWQPAALSGQMQRIRKKTKLPKDCRVYSLRHRLATVGVKAGVNLKSLSVIMGHADTKMLDRTYVHISNDLDHLKDAMDQIARYKPKG